MTVQLQHLRRRCNEIRFVVYQQDVRHEYPAKDEFFVVGRFTGRAQGRSSLSAFYLYKSTEPQAQLVAVQRRRPPLCELRVE
jgi:hypothetical protein